MYRELRRDLKAQTTLRWLHAMFAIALLLTTTVRAQVGGQLDSTFGNGGRTVIDLGRPFDDASAMAVQPDGKIVIAGTTSSARGCFAVEDQCDISVMRLNVDGSLDTTFGVGGIVAAGFANAQARAVFLDADGGILVAGQALLPAPIVTPFTQGEAHLALARFDSSGVLDPTFGTGGRTSGLVVTFGETQEVRIGGIDRSAGGALVAAVTFRNGVSLQGLVARFRPNTATPDPGFNGDGTAALPIIFGNSSAVAVLFQPDDGKVLVFGTAVIGGNQNVIAARFDTAGAPDETFGDGGLVATDIQGTDAPRAAVLQSDGAIVVAGIAGGDLALVRYLPDGQRDTSFSDDGKVTTDFSGGNDTAQALVLQPDGKIVVVGSAGVSGIPRGDFAIARYNADGSPDVTFGNSGIVRTDFGLVDDLAAAVVLDVDGRIVAAGRSGLEEAHDVAVARYQPGTEADLTVRIIGPASPVDVGQTFDYTLVVTNRGPDVATNAVIRDFLPAGLSVVACQPSSGGVCTIIGGTATIRYATLPAVVTVTLRVTLSPTVADGTSLTNTATVSSDAVDPDASNNSASAVIVARAVPHTLRFFLHGTDIPGTAGGFTMNAIPAAAQPIQLNLRNNPSWSSDPALSGVVAAGGTMRLIRPCTLGLGLTVTYRLAKTDLGGGNEQPLGTTQRLLAPCVGQEVIAIPITTPVAFANERIRLTISSGLGLNLDLQLGEGTFLEIANFAGTP